MLFKFVFIPYQIVQDNDKRAFSMNGESSFLLKVFGVGFGGGGFSKKPLPK